MFKAELVCFVKGTLCGAYMGGDFKQISIVGSSDISEEKALEDAYRQALVKYGITSDEIKTTNSWREKWYEIKLEKSSGFASMIQNQYLEPKRLSRQEQRRRQLEREKKNAV